VILLDSLNRHMLGAYGSGEFDTPNIDRFATRSVRFTNHHSGSLPCIPARHDLLVGAWDFLWKPWGSIELWEEPITKSLRRNGVVTQLITDHPHLFETGGENYHTEFSGWDYLRGHEGDPWKTVADSSWIGAPSFGRGHTNYDNSRGWFTGESDFPGPRTMTAAANWLEKSAPHHRANNERFFLLVDEFDPHEPFDTPEPWASMYDDSWQGPNMIWPPYSVGAIAEGTITAREGQQIRAQYGAKLSMIDHWFGKVLDALDRTNAWQDTAVVLCTDHGHYLGESDASSLDLWGKPAIPVYKTLGHIPMCIAWPGVSAGTCDALTTTTDIHATLGAIFGAPAKHATHGQSLIPLIDGSAASVREWLLTGVWGREVELVTTQFRYARAPQNANVPLSMWSNRWSTMPIHSRPDISLPMPDYRASLDFMPASTVPVIRQPFQQGDLLPFWAYAKKYESLFYDRIEDPEESRNDVASAVASGAVEMLREALVAVQAPSDHFERLGLG